MKDKILFVLILGGMLISSSALAQLTLKAQIRTRGEADNGYKQLPDSTTKDHYFVSQRSRITADYSKDKLTMRIALQDVRHWGDDDQFTKGGNWGNSNSLNVYEAWVKLKMGEHHTFKIGRQELKYDDQRLFSWRNWMQFGMSYDAFLYQYQRKGWKMDVMLSYNDDNAGAKNNAYFDGSATRRMKTVNFLYLNKKFNRLGVSMYLAGAGYHKANSEQTIYMTGTYGAHLSYTLKTLKLKGNYFGQFGKSHSGADIQGAYMLTADAEVGLLKKKLFLNIGYDRFSGADGTDTSAAYRAQAHTFDLMYGARYRYNGNMNLFILMDKHTANGGLNDIHFGAKYKFTPMSFLKAEFHLFSSAEKVFKANDANGNRIYHEADLGKEIDIVYSHSLSKVVNVKAGFSYYMSTDAIESFKKTKGEVGTPYWGWVMLTVKPTLFTTK